MPKASAIKCVDCGTITTQTCDDCGEPYCGCSSAPDDDEHVCEDCVALYLAGDEDDEDDDEPGDDDDEETDYDDDDDSETV